MHICVYMDLTSWKTCLFLLWTYFILFSFTVKHPRYFIREDWQQQTDRHRSTSPSKLFSSSTDLQGQPFFHRLHFTTLEVSHIEVSPRFPCVPQPLLHSRQVSASLDCSAARLADALKLAENLSGAQEWKKWRPRAAGVPSGNMEMEKPPETRKFHEISLLTYIAKICQSWTIPILIFADIDTLSMVPEKA